MRHAAWMLTVALTCAAPATAQTIGAQTNSAQMNRGGPARWSAFADCAAAYRADARLAPPDRPPSMTAQIAEAGGDYARAALARYVRQRKATPRAAQHAVDARIAAASERLSGRPPRRVLEHLIDACPQLDG